MITKAITFCGQKATHACDGRCDKAWGSNSRPTVPARKDRATAPDPDDFSYLSDDELGTAPIDPGTFEGYDEKPISVKGPDDINRWCVRECERAWISPPGHPDAPPELPDFSVRLYNIAPHRRNA
jgi:hypothetical protein